MVFKVYDQPYTILSTVPRCVRHDSHSRVLEKSPSLQVFQIQSCGFFRGFIRGLKNGIMGINGDLMGINGN